MGILSKDKGTLYIDKGTLSKDKGTLSKDKGALLNDKGQKSGEKGGLQFRECDDEFTEVVILGLGSISSVLFNSS